MHDRIRPSSGAYVESSLGEIDSGGEIDCLPCHFVTDIPTLG